MWRNNGGALPRHNPWYRVNSMSPKFVLACPECGGVVAGDHIVCERCGLPRVVRMMTDQIGTPQDVIKRPGDSLWKYFPLLPVENRDNIVSLHEGMTPVVEAKNLASRTGLTSVFLKNEILNPTGSFKDRQVSVGISKARELGAGTVAVVSSGNVAAAAAAYAAHAGMECCVFVARHAPETKLVQVKVCGAKAYRVDSAYASEIFSLVIAACNKFGWYHLSTAGMYNPFNVEGAKTISYELYEQFPDGLPEFVIVPVGGGGLLGAVWRGFTDLAKLGLISHLPKLVGVQAAGCAPFVRAINHGESPSDTFGNPWTNPETIAGGIADDVVFDAHTAIPAVRSTGGTAVAVDDAQILAAERLLALTEGVFCEPSSATTIAALEPLREMNVLTETSTVCCLITGGGFKDVESAQSLVEETRLIPAELSAIAHPVSS